MVLGEREREREIGCVRVKKKVARRGVPERASSSARVERKGDAVDKSQERACGGDRTFAEQEDRLVGSVGHDLPLHLGLALLVPRAENGLVFLITGEAASRGHQFGRSARAQEDGLTCSLAFNAAICCFFATFLPSASLSLFCLGILS